VIDLSLRWVQSLSLSAVSLLLAACALTPPPPKAPPTIQAAERHNSRGITALEQGRFAAAETEFNESYRDYASVENFPGMVMVLINSSRLYRKHGEIARAAAMMDQAGNLAVQVPALAAEVWFEKGKIAALSNDLDGAVRWADKALQSADDNNRAMILNFYAVVLFQAHDLPQAAQRAEGALKESRGSGDRLEEANALRTLADIALSRRAAQEAERYYRQALEIDKQLAVSSAVYGDLHGLATTMLQQGRQRSAADYLIRAAETALAGGNSAGALSAYAQAVDLCLQTGDTAAAAEVTDKLNRLRRETSGSGRQ
jgi:tetratricopeptide (TPR) repeat protein